MIDTDWVMSTRPYPAESRTMTSPPALACAIAAANPRQGWVRVHGLASLPYDATNVRCAVAKAVPETINRAAQAERRTTATEAFAIEFLVRIERTAGARVFCCRGMLTRVASSGHLSPTDDRGCQGDSDQLEGRSRTVIAAGRSTLNQSLIRNLAAGRSRRPFPGPDRPRAPQISAPGAGSEALPTGRPC